MGSCCSHEGKGIAWPVESEVESREYDDENGTTMGDDGVKVRMRGSSKFVSMYSQQGRKGVNQDAMTVWEDFTGEKDMIFCGVFDGHGPLGHRVARHVRDNLPLKLSEAIKMSQNKYSSRYDEVEVADKDSNEDGYESNSTNLSHSFGWEEIFVKSFKELDDKLGENSSIDSYCSGNTAVTVIKQGDNLVIGNLGDSRAVLCRRTEKNEFVPIQLTVDLKPNIPSEAERIRKCNGRVFAAKEEPDVYRLWMPEDDCPGLAMARAFGDFCLKDYGLSAIPDVFFRKLTANDEFVVLASDGVWDVLSNTEVVNIVAAVSNPSIAAKLLVKYAVRTWRCKYPDSKVDDCAVVILFLKNQVEISQYAMSKVKKEKGPSGFACYIVCHGSSKSFRRSNSRQDWSVIDGLSRANTVVDAPPRIGRVLSRRRSFRQCEEVAVR